MRNQIQTDWILDHVPKLNGDYAPAESQSLDRQQLEIGRQKGMEKNHTERFLLEKNNGKRVANYKWLVREELNTEMESLIMATQEQTVHLRDVKAKINDKEGVSPDNRWKSPELFENWMYQVGWRLVQSMEVGGIVRRHIGERSIPTTIHQTRENNSAKVLQHFVIIPIYGSISCSRAGHRGYKKEGECFFVDSSFLV